MSDPVDRLTEAQQAAVAKIACGSAEPGSLVLLCGPRGVGKTAVLSHLARSGFPGRSIGLAPTGAWSEAATIPEVVLADDAHEADEATLVRLLARCHDLRPAASLVLAGEGRLFTLVARDSRLEQAVRLRVTLPAFLAAETRSLLEARIAVVVGRRVVVAEAASRVAHEITGGAPAAVIRLAELAGVLVAAQPGRDLSAADIEAVHRRLSPLAA